MPYASNLPIKARPRGLGELAEAASGFGTWVVDMHWGLSPANIQGQNRPYGAPVVQTHYPRSQDPRLLNLHMGPVVAAGSWPKLKPIGSWPGVFRTPVERPGVRQTSMPPIGMEGYGHVPMGVAHAPWDMIPAGEPNPHQYEQMPSLLKGYAGYGAEDVAGGLNFTAADVEFIKNNEGAIRNAFFSFAQSYVAAANTMARFDDTYADLVAVEPNPATRRELAERMVFGTAGSGPTRKFLEAMEGAREQLAGSVTAGDISSWPKNVQDSWRVFMGSSAGSTGMSGFGDGGTTAATAGLAALLVKAGVGASVAGPLAALVVVVVVVGVLVAAVAITYGLIWSAFFSGAAEVNARATADNAASAARTRDAKWQMLSDLKNRSETAQTPLERERAFQQYMALLGATQKTEKKEEGRKAAETVAGGGGIKTWHMIAVATGLAVVLTYLKYRMPGGGGGRGGGGGAASVQTLRSATQHQAPQRAGWASRAKQKLTGRQ